MPRRKRKAIRRRDRPVKVGGGFQSDAPKGEKAVKLGGGFHEDAPHKVKVPKIQGIKL